MRKVFFIALVVLLTTGLYAQNTLFAAKKGIVLTYQNSDDKGKTSGYSVMTIKDVKGSGKNMTIYYGMAALDKNRKPIKDFSEKDLTVEIKNDVIFFDMNQLIPAEIQQQGVKMEVSGIRMELPNNLQPGQKIKDSNVTMTMDLGIMKTNSVLKMTDGKCLAIENVTVPAGTFKCHKITQTITTTTMGINAVTKSISWYAPDIGTVKTETYDDKDKVASSTILIEKKGG
ncbi:MAG: hypothetical protein LBU82_04375 [Treponema sp.]|jgi:hypothetical protein|nr:hypothetical protein [Treponema sp.]